MKNRLTLFLKPSYLAAHVLSAAALLLSFNTSAATFKTWSGNYPTTGSVTIPAGVNVLLDTNLNLSNLTIAGKISCAEQDLNIRSGWIMVEGDFECGTLVTPYFHKLSITLTGNDPSQNIMSMGTKFLGAMGHGSIQLQGTQRTNWTRLARTAAKGAREISVQGNIDWKNGEKLVIASSDYNASHAEEVTINSVSGGRIGITTPLVYQHWCQKDTYTTVYAMSECAEVGLLNRNITIQGDAGSATNGFGGHIMIMRGSSAKIGSVELVHMGQKNLLGRYPMHWHLVGEAPGQYLRDSSIHHAYNRFVSIHGTNQILLYRNVGYDTLGHGFYLEDGIEERNALAWNLGLLTRNNSDGKPTASDRNASVFWISNPNNNVRDNTAAGSEDTGFWLGFPEHPVGLSSTNTIWPRRTPLREFFRNVSHSNRERGLYVDGGELPDRTVGTTWYEPRVNPADNKSALVTPIFRNFTAYKNRKEGMWIRSFAGPIITEARLADNWMGAYFANIISGPDRNNVGYVQNSLVVGETANKGNPEIWETKGLDGRDLPRFWSPNDSIRGIEFYDGPMTVRNSLFVNFQSNSQRKAGGLTNLAPNPYNVSSVNAAEKVTFLNANRVYFDDLTAKNNGDAFSAFLDIDGSVSGSAGVRIVPKNPLMVTGQCTVNTAWNAYVCPHDYVNLRIFDRAGGSPSGTRVQRDDGAILDLVSPDKYTDQVNANLLAERPHALTFQGETSKYLDFVVSEKAGKAVRLSMPYAFANFTVLHWGSPVARAASLAELTTGGHKYFHDGSRLYLRLVSEKGGWEEVEVKRP